MKLDELYMACEKFEKLAQQKTAPKVVLDPKKSNIEFWSKFLYNAIGSYSYMFSSPKIANDIFKKIAIYNTSPAYGSDKEIREINSIEAALDEASSKLQAAGINPIEALKQKGMQNVNPNILGVIKSNLQVIKEAKDFSKYQHYYLPRSGEVHPKDVIDLDEKIDKGPGY